jgi:guanyl-specific ribonuclease Sa
MKNFLVLVGILCCLFFSFSGCGGGDTSTGDEVEEAMDAAEESAQETAEDAESLMDQAEEAADEAAESAKELADEAEETVREMAD